MPNSSLCAEPCGESQSSSTRRNAFSWSRSFLIGLMFIGHRFYVDFVVVGMGIDPFDEYDLQAVVDSHNQPVIVALEVKDDAIRANDAGVGVLKLAK